MAIETLIVIRFHKLEVRLARDFENGKRACGLGVRGCPVGMLPKLEGNSVLYRLWIFVWIWRFKVRTWGSGRRFWQGGNLAGEGALAGAII